eukprot:600964-Rhodomonas_salina.1
MERYSVRAVLFTFSQTELRVVSTQEQHARPMLSETDSRTLGIGLGILHTSSLSQSVSLVQRTEAVASAPHTSLHSVVSFTFPPIASPVSSRSALAADIKRDNETSSRITKGG